MKKTLHIFFVLIGVLVCFNNSAKAQDFRKNIRDLALMKADASNNAKLYLGDNKSTASTILGVPSSTGTEYFEIDNVTAEVWFYNQNKLYFVNNALVSYELKDATIAVGESLVNAFKVGTKLTYTYGFKVFLGYPVMGAGVSRNIDYSFAATYPITNTSFKLDGYLEVLFNSNEEIFNIVLEN